MSKFVQQFGHPTGALGWLVGHLMAVKNGARSRWALEVLAPKRDERVLEIGFGPGVDLARLAKAVGSEGFVAGVDVSAEMVRQANSRNQSSVRAGRMELRQGSAGRLPFETASFDAAYASNSAQFWPDLPASQRELWRVLRPGGRAVIVVQPMWRGATADDSLRWRDRLRDSMILAGFDSVHTRELELRPTLTVAVIGAR